MIKPFIHPDILLTVRQNIHNDQDERLDSLKFEEAKNKGKEFANEILTQLFKPVEYGKIESHFNTERLNSTKFKNIREQIINLHFQREVLSQEVKKISVTHDNLQEQLLKKQKSFFRLNPKV